MSQKHIPGMGCKCEAWSEGECGCADVDWRSAREVELEGVVNEAQACLRDVMKLVQEFVMAADVDIDHDEVWQRWVKACGDSPNNPTLPTESNK